MAWRGMDSMVADEMAILPGMDELANLLWINQHHDSGQYDVVVVDAAPTGETLRLLSFPDVLSWWMERLFPIQRKAMGVARPLLRTLVDIPLPSDEVYAAVERLFGQLERLHKMMVDPELTSIRLVFNPERMVVKEAQRTYLYLNLFQYPSDLAGCNRRLPQAHPARLLPAREGAPAPLRPGRRRGLRAAADEAGPALRRPGRRPDGA